MAAVLLTGGALGGVLMATADSFGAALLAGFLIGGGAGGEYDINPYLLSRYFGLRSLATLYGFNWMALGLASAIGPILMDAPTMRPAVTPSSSPNWPWLRSSSRR